LDVGHSAVLGEVSAFLWVVHWCSPREFEF
jgi:hypothetical protein